MRAVCRAGLASALQHRALRGPVWRLGLAMPCARPVCPALPGSNLPGSTLPGSNLPSPPPLWPNRSKRRHRVILPRLLGAPSSRVSAACLGRAPGTAASRADHASGRARPCSNRPLFADRHAAAFSGNRTGQGKAHLPIQWPDRISPGRGLVMAHFLAARWPLPEHYSYPYLGQSFAAHPHLHTIGAIYAPQSDPDHL